VRTRDAVEPQILNIVDNSKRLDQKNPLVLCDAQIRVGPTLHGSNRLARLQSLEKRVEIASIGTGSTAETERLEKHQLRGITTDMIHKLTWFHCWETEYVPAKELPTLDSLPDSYSSLSIERVSREFEVGVSFVDIPTITSRDTRHIPNDPWSIMLDN
jgi:hypothetical protein